MNKQGDWGAALASVMSAVFDHVLVYLPNIVGAVALLVIGWVLARLLRVVTRRAAMLFDQALSRLIGPGSERLRMGTASRVLGTIVFWIVLLFFATAATEVLGLAPFTLWLSQFVAYLPTLAAGVLIVVAGYALGRVLSDLVRTTATSFTPVQRAALGRVVQTTIVAIAVLIGADQIGIKVTFLVVFVAAVAAAVIAGVALSVGLGARDYVANLIGAHHLRQAVQAGQIVRVDGVEGRVINVTATALIVETDDGRVNLPARVYNERAITVIASDSHG